jgi:hypothetical protein
MLLNVIIYEYSYESKIIISTNSDWVEVRIAQSECTMQLLNSLSLRASIVVIGAMQGELHIANLLFISLHIFHN